MLFTEVETKEDLNKHLQFTEKDLLGEGAFAAVYKAYEISSKKTVAVKVSV